MTDLYGIWYNLCKSVDVDFDWMSRIYIYTNLVCAVSFCHYPKFALFNPCGLSKSYGVGHHHTHYPLYLVYLFWWNKSPWKQSVSITYITIVDTTYSHIFPINFFFHSYSGTSVLVSFIVLCILWRMQFCVCCILITLAGMISPCRVSWSCWSALDVKLNKLRYYGEVLCLYLWKNFRKLSKTKYVRSFRSLKSPFIWSLYLLKHMVLIARFCSLLNLLHSMLHAKFP